MSSRIRQDSRSQTNLPRFSQNRLRAVPDLLVATNDHFKSLGVRRGRLGPHCDLIFEPDPGTGSVGNAQTVARLRI